MGQPDQSDTQVSTDICRTCGALYHVSMRRVEVLQWDWYHCAICGRLLGEWESTYLPTYSFVRPGPEYPPRKPR
jgi:hypothetical protein